MAISTKICGLKTQEAIEAAIEGGAEYLGFIFYPPSPRNITPEDARKLLSYIKKRVKKVAVAVDADDKLLQKIIDSLQPDFLQLHGNEAVSRVMEIKRKFKLPVIKAVKISTGDDIAAAGAYQVAADILLFDARPNENVPGMLPGGNGLTFDWYALAGRNFAKPWILSGGLSSANVAKAVEITGAKIVDVSSSLENEPGQKDPKLIKEFLETVRSL